MHELNTRHYFLFYSGLSLKYLCTEYSSWCHCHGEQNFQSVIKSQTSIYPETTLVTLLNDTYF